MKNISQQHSHDGVARIARNSAFLFLTKVLDIGVALAAIALIARYFGVVDFGHYAFVVAITIFLGPVIDLGFERITTREIASNRKLRNKYLGLAVTARIFLSVVIILIIYFAMGFFDWDKQVVKALYISTFNQVLVAMGMLAIGTFQAFERMEYQLGFKFFFNILYLVLVVAVIRYDLGFLAVFGARMLASLAQTTVMMVVAFKKFLRPVFEIDIEMFSYLFREAIPLGIFAVLLTASFKVDVFVLRYFRGPEDISLFEAAHRIIMQLQLFPMSIIIALFPYFSRQAKASMDALSASFYKSFKFIFIMSLPLPILITFSSDGIISILFGEAFSAASSSLVILSWSISFLFLITLQSFVMTSEGRQRLNAISAGICFIINLLLDMLLVPTYGYIGASYATLISYIVFFAVSFYFVSKTVGVPPIGEILPKLILSAGAMGIVGAFLFQRGGPIMIAVESFIITLVYVIMIHVLKIFTQDEVSIIKRVFLGQKRKGSAL